MKLWILKKEINHLPSARDGPAPPAWCPAPETTPK
jgi:hypothetical protein